MSTYSDAVQLLLKEANLSAAYDPNDPLTPTYQNLVALYANKKMFAGQIIRNNSSMMEAMLRARQLIYYKKTPGDCGTATKISPSALVSGSKAGLLAAGTLTTLASAGVYGGTAGTAGIAAEVSSVAVSGAFAAATAGIGLALVPVFMILQHHQAAVAKEQSGLCEVSGFVNSGFQAVIAANIDWTTRKNYLNQIAKQGIDALTSIAQGDINSAQCNAACMFINVIYALRDLFIMLYASAPSPSIISGIDQTQVSGPTQTNSQGGSTPDIGPNVALVGGGAALGLHFLGAF